MRIFTALLLFFVVHVAAAQQPPTGTAPPAGSHRVEGQPQGQPPKQDLTSLPMGKGLPVTVRVGIYFQSVTAFDDNEGTFTGSVDMRLRWEDPRLRYPAETTPRGFQEYRGPEADQKLKE